MDHENMLSWAGHHLQIVEKSCNAFFGTDPYIASSEIDHKRHLPDALEYSFTVRPRKPIRSPSEYLPFEIGDTLHALRVSLDYLAVRTVMKAIPSADESKVSFPIITNKRYLKWAQREKLRGAKGGLLDAFKACQPCLGPKGSKAKLHPLAILDALEQPHKHRRLLSAYGGVTDFLPVVITGREDAVSIVHITRHDGPLEKKAEIARYRIATDADGNPKALMQATVRYFICFDKTGPAEGAPVVRQLREIGEYIRNEVFPRFAKLV